ncbi:hypothetical protein GTO27_09680 [Candidatus Bathyarchaeota archaeon]|nr:hypothetical protein [Candidatus Bathyarchaeota archaeon]
MKCAICDKKATAKGFCKLHAKAYNNIIKKFDEWKQAKEISWKEYLSEIAKNSLTGEWAREVTEYLFERNEKLDVT